MKTRWWERYTGDDPIDEPSPYRMTVGLPPRPWEDPWHDNMPTYGYDGHLTELPDDVDDHDSDDPIVRSGRTKDEWLELAQVMKDRWAEFEAWLKEQP